MYLKSRLYYSKKWSAILLRSPCFLVRSCVLLMRTLYSDASAAAGGFEVGYERELSAINCGAGGGDQVQPHPATSSARDETDRYRGHACHNSQTE